MMQINLKKPALAINGGDKIREAAWKDNFTIGKEEKEAALRALDSGYLSLFEGSHTPDAPFSFLGGPEVQALEAEWCDYYGSNHSVSMNSATSGLFAAVGALGVGFGDEVIVSPYTMTACALAPLIYGAIPVFADVSSNSGCITPSSIESLITPRTKAIIVVHQFGFPAQMDEIMAIARKFNLAVIEDCAQAHGAKYRNQYVGTIGDIGVFSLNVNKTIQTGEGAVCTTNCPELAYRLQLIRNHGEAVVGPANYGNIENIAGFNYRFTEVGAAMAREQLIKLRTLNDKRLEFVSFFHEKISNLEFLSPLLGDVETISPTYYVCPVKFLGDIAGVSRDDFITAVNAEGAQFYQGYVKPLYYQPLYQRQHLFKNGYPFSAPENALCSKNYAPGTSPMAEKLHFEQMLINEHIRPPQKKSDIADLVACLEKVAGV